MIVIAAYDIVQDGRRSKVAAVLQAYGERIQKSVFVLDTTPENLDEIRERVAGILDLDEDSVYFVGQCGACWTRLGILGQADRPAKVLHWAIW